MAAVLEETPVTYEELNDMEREFDDVETEIIRLQDQMTRPLYEKRQKMVSQIPNFWPLVIEQAPPDIDEYIQPSDSALLLSSLTAMSVTRFEIDPSSSDSNTQGDPRSIAIRWEFSDNDYFEDRVIEKRFWYRRSFDGWGGLVSEPIEIRWKKGKDLTGGLLAMVKRVWDEEQKQSRESAEPAPKRRRKEKPELTAEQRALKKKIENTGLGGLSFFAWFGFVGRKVSAEESRQVAEKERERRKPGVAADEENQSADDGESEDGEDEEDEEEEDSLEIFPDGDTLALTIAEDLWPGAIKYFTQAQEQDALSDDDFESDEEPGGDEAEQPIKKRKS